MADPTNKLKSVSDSDFESTIAQGVVLVDFFAEWCGPCHMQTPILEELAEEMADKVSIVKLDIDHNQQTTAKFGVTSVPTLILFSGGKETKRIVGLRDADALRSLIESV